MYTHVIKHNVTALPSDEGTRGAATEDSEVTKENILYSLSD